MKASFVGLISSGIFLSAAVAPANAQGGFKASRVDGIEFKVGDEVVWSETTFLSPNSLRGYFYHPDTRAFFWDQMLKMSHAATQKMPRGMALVRQKLDLSPGCAPEVTYGPGQLALNISVPRSIFFTNVTTPGPLPQGTDPRFSVDFDVTGSAIVSIPAQAHQGVTIGPIKARIFNIKPSGQNFTGDLAVAVAKVVDEFKDFGFASRLSQGFEFTQKPITLKLGELSRVLRDRGRTQKVEHSYDPQRRVLVLQIQKLKPIGSTGKARPSTSQPAGPSPKPPYITAAPPIIPVAKGQSQGTTTLIWDGGPDHPYAEVWVSVNGGDETKVLEQGKGTRKVTAEQGKSYTYILTDAGKRLGTVAVEAKPISPF